MPTGARALLASPLRLVMALALGLMAAGMLAPSGELRTTAATEVVGTAPLTDDAGSRALFDTDLLAPGQVVANCIEVEYGGPTEEALALIGAVDVDGPLAEHLWLRIESGTGGRYGDCDGFVGSEVFDGTLDEFAAATASGGTAAGWDPRTDARRSFRIVAEVLPVSDAADTWALADLVWTVEAAAPPPDPEPTPDPEPEPTPDPTPAPTPDPDPGEETPVPTPSPAPQPPQLPGDAPEDPETSLTEPDPGPGSTGSQASDEATTEDQAPVPPSADDDADPDPPDPASPEDGDVGDGEDAPLVATAPSDGQSAEAAGLFDRAWAALTRVGAAVLEASRAAGHVVVGMAQRGEFPVAMLALLGFFLLLQNRLDSRDPKLALAPMYPDPELPFLDPAARDPLGALMTSDRSP